MGQNILLVETCKDLRTRLKNIFKEDQRVSHIYEADTRKGLEVQLHNRKVDLVVINQALITDIMSLPEGNFVVLTSKLDMAILKAAYKRRARGYLSENISEEFLRNSLDYHEKAFLIDPNLTPWVMDKFWGDAFLTLNEKILTPREKEIVALLRQSIDRPTIARRLCIAEATLKTHIKNIARKGKV